MTDKQPIRFTEDDIAEIARDIGKPLPADMKRRIMAKVHERAVELSKKAGKKSRAGK